MNFSKGKIFQPMVRFAIPILGALFLQNMYGAVDMMVVGQFATAADVSAVSTGSWLMNLVVCVIVGLSMGTTVMLGRKIGEDHPQEGGKIIGASIALFAVLALVVTVVMELFSVQLVHIMQMPAEAVDAAVAYLRICSAGAVFIVAYNVLGSIFKGIGNSKIPLLTVTIACVVNIIGDLVLVGGLHMAAAGAAIATVLAQAVSVVLSLLLIRNQKFPFTLKKEDIRFDGKWIAPVVRIGLPVAFQDFLVSISFLVIPAIVNSLGVTPSAGVGVAEKLCGFIMLVPSAFSQTMSAYVSQNMGAGEYDRAKKGLFYGIATSFAVGVVMFYLAFFHGDAMSRLFAKDPEVVLASAQYLKSYAIDCLLTSFLFCLIGYFNGCGRTTFVLIQGLTGAFGVRIPVSYFMSKVVPVSLFKIGLATPCSSFVQIVLCMVYLIYIEKKRKSRE